MEKYTRKYMEYLHSNSEIPVELELEIGKILKLILLISYEMKNSIPRTAMNWVFANIEQNSSRRREGIVETLFESGTAILNNRDKKVRPFSAGILENTPLSRDHIDLLARQAISNAFDNHRFSEQFGIYENNNKMIYQPLIDRKKLEEEYSEFWNILSKDLSFDKILYSHIAFEKIHPYADGNGRIGRYILEKQLNKYFADLIEIPILNKVWPISYMSIMPNFFYYDCFEEEKDPEEVLTTLAKGIREVFERTYAFIVDVNKMIDKHLENVKSLSPSLDEWKSRIIISSFMQNQSNVIKKFELDPKTVKKIYEKLNMMGMINIVTKGTSVYYFNLEIEELIIKHFPMY